MADVRTTPIPDTQTIAEAPHSPTHVATRREDYRPPDWLVPAIRLDFDLEPERTHVRATLSVRRSGDHDRPLKLDGSELKLLSVKVDDADAEWPFEDSQLLVEPVADEATVETEVECT